MTKFILPRLLLIIGFSLFIGCAQQAVQSTGTLEKQETGGVNESKREFKLPQLRAAQSGSGR